MITDFEKSINQLINKFEDEFYWSLTESENGTKLFYSDNIEKVTGYSSEEIKAMDGRGKNIIYKDDLPLYRKIIDRFENNSNKKFLEVDYRIVHKSGRIIWIKEKINVTRSFDGKITDWYGNVRDISSAKESEEKLKNKIENLEQLNSSKDNFISILSHDLRAPFTSILGFSEILMNEAGISEKEKFEYLNYIHDSSQNQLQLINYLLDWSRLQTGRLKIEPQRLHVQSIVFNCVSALTAQAVRKNINIKVKIPDSMYIDADERLANLVFHNVISNAIKFSNDETVVEVFANIYNERLCEFVVKDEGIGISEENQEKIFNIGKMFSTEGTRGEKGTGLGLALVKQIVEKHKGNIWFYSEAGKGSEFRFTFPASTNTVLLVGSIKKMQSLIDEKLKISSYNFKTIIADNGFEALGLVSSKMPSLIVADHDMPLMDGYQFAKSVRKENKSLHTPILVLLKTNDEQLKHQYQEYGIRTLTLDPLDINLLNEKILSVLNSK